MDIKAKKSLGQNFLKDENILKKIANSFSTTCDDVIIEIGPGQGALTKHLVEKNGHLICYEIDTRMESLLLHFESEDTSIIFDDFLKRDITQDIPYRQNNPAEAKHSRENHVLLCGNNRCISEIQHI